VLLIAGCGGSGGGSSHATLTAVADWTHFGSGISGQSQRWSLYDSGDVLVQQIAIDHTSSGQQSVNFPAVPSGTYHIHVDLFSGLDLGGTLVGILDEQIKLSGLKSYTAAVGTDPASIKVTPTTATFKANASQQFYAAAYNSSAQPTFIAPNTITWSVNGTAATVDPATGVVQGVSAGTGSVLATHPLVQQSGAATFTVQSVSITTGKWTILVYMNAANDLFQFSTLNVNQMERVAGNPDVRFVVQWKQSKDLFSDSTFDGTRRYLVKQDTTTNIASELVQNMGTGVDMGDKNTLTDFINWGKTFYPAQHYVLVVWNHGNGWRRGITRDDFPTRAVSYDDQTGNSIQTWELAQALGSNHFDIVAWDASLMQMMEVADEIRDKTDYIAGSEESPPGAGYPYDLVFQGFRDNPNDTALNLAHGFVTGMIDGYSSDTTVKITQSVIDTSQLAALSTQIDALGQFLIANQASLGTLVPSVRNTAKSFSPTNGRVYRDLWDVCDRLTSGGGSIVGLQAACDNVKAAITAAVKWEGHNINSAGSHGISIDFSSSAQFAGSTGTDYANLRLANDTQWDEWLTVAP